MIDSVTPEIGSFVRETVLQLRAGLLSAKSEELLPERLDRFCDSLAAWCVIPARERRRYYGPAVLDCLFDLVAELEDYAELEDRDRRILELSIWDASVALDVDIIDERSEFIRRRRELVLNALVLSASSELEQILYEWAWLLRKRSVRIGEVAETFRDDAAAVTGALISVGAVQKAKALSIAFRLRADSRLELALRYQSTSDENRYTKRLLQRLRMPQLLFPYHVAEATRALSRFLSNPVIDVTRDGCISIGAETFGCTNRRY